MLDWEENDRYSFEDSERFEEDSLCSWLSEHESLCNNWRGWKRLPHHQQQQQQQQQQQHLTQNTESGPSVLTSFNKSEFGVVFVV